MVAYQNAPLSGIDWSKPDAQKNPATQPYFESAQIELFKSLGIDLSKDTYVKYNDIVAKLINDPQKRFSQHWDDEAKVPWLSVQSADGKNSLPSPMKTRVQWRSKPTTSKAKGWQAPCSGSTAQMTIISWRSS